MVTENAGPGQDPGSEDSDTSDEMSTIGKFARVALALCAVLLGIVWTARIAVDADLSSGAPLRLLPPLALIYLGIRFLRSVMGSD